MENIKYMCQIYPEIALNMLHGSNKKKLLLNSGSQTLNIYKNISFIFPQLLQ